MLLEKQRPAVIVGGFPHGHFSETTIRLADEVGCIDPDMLETWTLTSRVIYEYESAISLPKKRLKQQSSLVRPPGFEPGIAGLEGLHP